MRLAGKVALVTGAGRGIGRAVALAYAREGASLILCSRTQSELASAAKEAKALGARVLAKTADQTDPKQVSALVVAGMKEFGGIDILVNNAGILGPQKPLAEVSPSEWDETLKINLTGLFLMTREVLRAGLASKKAGCVINVSSGQGRRARAGWGPYAASKFGLEGLTQVLAGDYPSLRFYSVNPTATRTGMRAEAFPGEDPKTLKAPESVTEAFVALAADDCQVPSGSPIELERATGRLLVHSPPNFL